MTSSDRNNLSLWINPSGLPGGLGSDDDYHQVTRACTTFITPPVPEPGTILLLGCGLIGGGIIARRRRKER